MKFEILLKIVIICLITSCTTLEKTYQVIKDPDIRVGERLDQPSTYTISIYATNRANINMYSDDDNIDALEKEELLEEQLYEDDNVIESSIDDITENVGVLVSGSDVIVESEAVITSKQKLIQHAQDLQLQQASTDIEEHIIAQEYGKADSRATPVLLQVFQLKDKSLFMSATYEDFRDSDFEDFLGNAYISNDDLVIDPNQFKFIDTQKLHADTHYIGVVAYYNDYEGHEWRGAVKVKPVGGDDYPILIRVLESKVGIYKDN